MIGVLAAAALATGSVTVITRPAPIVWSTKPVTRGPQAGCVLIAEQPPLSEVTTLSWICPGKPAPTISEWAHLERRVRSLAIEPPTGDTVSVLIGLEGAIDRAEWTGDASLPVWRRWLSDDDIAPESLDDRPDLDADGSPDLLQVAFDGLRAYRATDGGFVPLWSIDLPGTVRSSGDSVIAQTGPLPSNDGTGSWRYTWPVGMRDGRVRLTMFELAATAPRTCMAYLRGEVELSPGTSALLPGAPRRLAFTSLPSRKLEIFGEHSINVAEFECDDTGRGRAIGFSTKTPLINWGGATLSVRDLTGDRVVDLVLVGFTGRLKPKPMLAVYPAIADGSFSKRALTWEPGDELERGRLIDSDSDYDGDGTIDLVAVGERDLYLFASTEDKRGSLPWNNKPAAKAAVSSEWRQSNMLAATDLDHDGSNELLLRVESVDEKGQPKRYAIVVVDLTPTSLKP